MLWYDTSVSISYVNYLVGAFICYPVQIRLPVCIYIFLFMDMHSNTSYFSNIPVAVSDFVPFLFLLTFYCLLDLSIEFTKMISRFVQPVAELAEDIWDRYGYDFGTDYSGLFKALSHVNYNVRIAAAEALAAALDENPDTIQVTPITNLNPVTNL